VQVKWYFLMAIIPRRNSDMPEPVIHYRAASLMESMQVPDIRSGIHAADFVDESSCQN
jgi:hypothetical protein